MTLCSTAFLLISLLVALVQAGILRCACGNKAYANNACRISFCLPGQEV